MPGMLWSLCQTEWVSHECLQENFPVCQGVTSWTAFPQVHLLTRKLSWTAAGWAAVSLVDVWGPWFQHRVADKVTSCLLVYVMCIPFVSERHKQPWLVVLLKGKLLDLWCVKLSIRSWMPDIFEQRWKSLSYNLQFHFHETNMLEWYSWCMHRLWSSVLSSTPFHTWLHERMQGASVGICVAEQSGFSSEIAYPHFSA